MIKPQKTMYDDEAERVIRYIIEDIDNATVKDVKRTLERAAQIFEHKVSNAIHQTQADSIFIINPPS